jgi:3-hydroxyisobutyrate dehydrogenase-like beta-hydroxyacid dehydrogenase
MKLVANLLVAVHNAAAAEALVLAERSGIDPATALRVLVGSAAGSRQLELRGNMMVTGAFEPPTATISIFLKDVALISEMARSAACPVPMHAATSSLFTAALAMGNADLDVSSVHKVLAALAGQNASPRPEAGTA